MTETHPYAPGTLKRFAHERVKLDVVVTELTRLQQQLRALEQEMRENASRDIAIRWSGFAADVTIHWANRLAAILKA